MPPSALEDRLLYHFYSWEHRGRGWMLYDAPVELEPPFRPFLWEEVSPPQAVDDGRHPTFLSRLVDLISTGSVSGRKQADPPVEEEIEEPDPEVLEETPPLVEIEIAIPTGLKIAKDTWLRFLRSLHHCHDPLAFEIVGTAERVTVQVVCSEDDFPGVQPQLEVHFPDCSFSEESDTLRGLWDGDSRHYSVIVDFGLSDEFMLPLETLSGFDPDPLTAVVGAMTNLSEPESAVFQVLFQTCRHPWAKNTLRSVTDWSGKPMFEDQNMLRLTQEKVSVPLYAVVVRVGARSPKKRRAWQVVRGLGGTLAQYTRVDCNELIPLTNKEYSDTDHLEDLVERRSHRSGMLLNVEELVSLAHLPSASVRAPKFRQKISKTKAAPEIAKGHSFVLGENTHQRPTTQVTLSPEQRSRHLYVIGASGTGKSTFLLNLIRQDLLHGNGLAVLDPHGDLIEEIISILPQERVADVILLDPSDQEYSLGFNILSAHSPQEKDLLASDLVSVFRRLSTSWGDQMNSVLANAILAFMESSRGGTLIDLRRFLVDKDFRNQFLPSVEDTEVRYFWLKEFPLLSGRPQAPILTRLDTFLRPKPIRYMVAQKESRLDFRRIMDEKRIFLAKLAQGAIGEENAYLLGSFLVSKIHQAAMGRQEQEASARIPFYLYIDECHHFVTPSMESILAGTRKYKLGLILAHQELRQLGSGDLSSAVLTNPYTRVCFRLGDTDAKKLADGFSFFEASDLQNLGTGEAIARIERADYDFNLAVPQLPSVDREYTQQVREYVVGKTRERYGTPRAMVEAELAKERVDIPPGPLPSRQSPEPPPNPTRTEFERPSAVEPPKPESMSAQSPALTPAAKPKIPPSVPPSPGRGGKKHKYLQQMIKQKGEELGYRALVEKVIEGGCVDVSLESTRHRVACEISVTSSPEQEMGNVAKCLTAGYESVVVVVAEQKRVSILTSTLSGTLTREEMDQVKVFTLTEALLYLDEIGAEKASSEAKVLGYKVKTNFKPVDEASKQQRKQTIANAISTAMKRSARQQE